MDMFRVTSPRISFSHDLDVAPIEKNESRRDLKLLESSGSDFEFTSFEQESTTTTSADELFSNGVILPVRIQEKIVQTGSLPPLPRPSSSSMVVEEEEEKAHQSKPCWGGFKRNCSLNCSLPRSNSTGSLPNKNKNSSTSSSSSQHKQQLLSKSKSSSTSSTCTYSDVYNQQKPPLKKNYGNGVKISPVLNMPSPYISKSLFGLGSLLRNGKDKKNNK